MLEEQMLPQISRKVLFYWRLILLWLWEAVCFTATLSRSCLYSPFQLAILCRFFWSFSLATETVEWGNLEKLCGLCRKVRAVLLKSLSAFVFLSQAANTEEWWEACGQCSSCAVHPHPHDAPACPTGRQCKLCLQHKSSHELSDQLPTARGGPCAEGRHHNRLGTPRSSSRPTCPF